MGVSSNWTKVSSGVPHGSIVGPMLFLFAITRNLIEDRYVIEIVLIKYTGWTYTTPQGKCYFRHKSANIELTTQEVREKTIHEQQASYNEELKRLRKELKGMRKQLAERSREADNNQSTFNVESKPEKQTNSSEYVESKPEKQTNSSEYMESKPEKQTKSSEYMESKPEKQTNSSEYTNEVEANGCVVM